MLAELGIRNFKAIRQGNFALRNLSLLTGVNGVGKSSVLQSLLLLRQSYRERFLDYSCPMLVLNGPLVNIGQAKDAYSQFGEEGCVELSIRSDNGIFSKWAFMASPAEGEVLQLAQDRSSVDRAIFDQNLFTNRFQHIPAERLAAMTTYPASQFNVSNLHQFGPQARYAVHLLHSCREQPLAIPQLRHETTNPEDNTVLSSVRAWLGEISPGIKLSTYLFENIDQVQLTFQYDAGLERGMTNEFRPINVGFGITYVLPLIIAILTAAPGDFLAIENPESHLHPRGQSRMGKLCSIAAQNGVQLLIESQSDHFLNGIRLSARNEIVDPEKVAIFFLDRTVGSETHSVTIRTPQLDRDGKLSEWPDGFFDEWDNIVFALA